MFHQVCTLRDRVSELLQYLKKNFTGDSFQMFVCFRGQALILSAVGRAFLRPWEELRWVGEKFAGGLALLIKH